ncbi:IucA/IucC family protein [Paenibacillus arenilitoris]|uniref:IucA/IucC family siderophore biosynthesis protein n=1 Tax=Paenibacillus arenilitoris TaxID=2772299 RepID=A0A927H7D7_9BACL|nr:IucA/IucC family protein [Paenibacillus arenilitoris]MBD2870543.1 IucA/IucC family siderophore biosynthesis protein [Paenibacillus arenilitoris]
MTATEIENAPPGLAAIMGSPAYAAARRRVFKQLTEALLYEDMVACRRRPVDGGAEEITITGADRAGDPVRYVCEGRLKLSFGKFKLTPRPVRRVSGGEESEAEDVALFLQEIWGAMVEEPRHIAAFVRELEQTLLKDAAARYDRLVRPVGKRRKLEELEGDVLEAHPYHPCFKSRIGFNLADNERYGPEFHPQFKLLWLAVRREDAVFALSAHTSWEEHMTRELGEAVFARFREKLALLGREPDAFVFVPVHPWQWEHKVASLFYRFIADGRMVVLGEGEDEYSPQQSIRTLSNRTSPLKDNVKTAISIVNTSAVRILGTHHVTNGPILSDWLEAIVEGDRYFRERARLILLKEHAGVSFRYELLPEPVREDGYGTLGAIWRESVHRHLEEGEEAVPFTVLCHIGADGRPFIHNWVKKEGLEKWLNRLLAVSIHPLVHLLLAHGVAMESHGQNLVLIARNGRPERIAVRDLPGGVRFYTRSEGERARLAGLRDSDPLHPNSYSTSPMETDNVNKIRNFLMDSFFQIMLAELCLVLEEYYGLKESAFWRAAAEQIHSYLRQFGQGEPPPYDLFAETIDVGQLTRRRLFGEHVIRNHAVANPLFHLRETGV